MVSASAGTVQTHHAKEKDELIRRLEADERNASSTP
jgi:hypothetical protein